MGVDQPPILQKSKSETPALSDLSPSHEEAKKPKSCHIVKLGRRHPRLANFRYGKLGFQARRLSEQLVKLGETLIRAFVKLGETLIRAFVKLGETLIRAPKIEIWSNFININFYQLFINFLSTFYQLFYQLVYQLVLSTCLSTYQLFINFINSFVNLFINWLSIFFNLEEMITFDICETLFALLPGHTMFLVLPAVAEPESDQVLTKRKAWQIRYPCTANLMDCMRFRN